MRNILLLSLFAFLTVQSCKAPRDASSNPPAPGFRLSESDPKAIAIADETMKAMGGRENWDKARYFSWDFFGSRQLVWDKKKGDVRIVSPKDETVYLLNIHTMKGKVKRKGVVETNPDTLKMLLDKGKSIWINDSYWLVMPYKLKDSGVALKYAGEGKTEAGGLADILQLTFEKVGVTPENKYLVYVDKNSKLVTQWSFFKNAEKAEPDFSTPWDGWKKYGNIMLSDGRGKRGLSDISVVDNLPTNVFTEF